MESSIPGPLPHPVHSSPSNVVRSQAEKCRQLSDVEYSHMTELSTGTRNDITQCASGIQALPAGDTTGHILAGGEDRLGSRQREIRYATDGGVRLAGGRIGEERDTEEVAESVSEGSTFTMPPPYVSISFP